VETASNGSLNRERYTSIRASDRGTAGDIRDEHDANAAADGAKHRRVQANIGFAARDETPINQTTIARHAQAVAGA